VKLAASLALCALALIAPAAHAQESGGFCPGDTTAEPPPPGPEPPRLRFGITPSGAAGQLGPVPSPFEPDDPAQMLDALARLRPQRGPFVTHVYSSWEDAGTDEDRRLSTLAERYSDAGYLVEFVLRYKPKPEDEGNVAAYVEWVRHVVRLLGPNRRVVALQITNEVNFTASPDSSDGAYEGARDALVQGVIGADDEARRRGYDQLEIGFNWIYRLDPDSERSFWRHLGQVGGDPFRAALDWIGLDAYPGTFFPPQAAPGQERDFMVNAMSSLRECYAPIAGIGPEKPIHIQENGFPTGSGRTYERQAEALRNMVTTVHEQRGVYGVSDYRWFNMRDADTESPNFQQQYGLMTDAYVPKPAFDEYERLVEQLSTTEEAPGASATRRVRLRLTYWRGRDARGRACARGNVRAVVVGSGRGAVERAVFRLRRRRVGRDRRAPFAFVVRAGAVPRGARARIRVLLDLGGGDEIRRAAGFRRC
jgi:hypothetical protein